MFTTVKQLLRRVISGAPADIVSFPKCGRTWLRMMLGSALQKTCHLSEDDPLELEQYHDHSLRIPRIRIRHVADPFNKRADELTLPLESFRSHRVLLLIRDPRDVLVSSYFHKTKRDGVRRRTLDDKYDPLGELVPYSRSLHEYVTDPVGSLDTLLRYYCMWHDQRHSFGSYLLVRYEELRSSPDAQLRRVLAFIGFRHVKNEIITSIVEECSFDNMRKLEESKMVDNSRLLPGDVNDPESYKTRRGKVGGYRDYLSADDIAYINSRMSACLHESLRYESD